MMIVMMIVIQAFPLPPVKTPVKTFVRVPSSAGYTTQRVQRTSP